MADIEHHQISAQISTLRDHMDKSHDALSAKIDKLADVTGQNAIALTHLSGRMDTIDTEIGGMKTTRGELVEWVRGIDNNLSVIRLDNARHDGERGVWAALVKSPAVGWLLGAAVAVWAFISQSAGR